MIIFKRGDLITNTVQMSIHDNDTDIKMIIQKSDVFVVEAVEEYKAKSSRKHANYIFKSFNDPFVFMKVDSFTARNYGFRKFGTDKPIGKK